MCRDRQKVFGIVGIAGYLVSHISCTTTLRNCHPTKTIRQSTEQPCINAVEYERTQWPDHFPEDENVERLTMKGRLP